MNVVTGYMDADMKKRAVKLLRTTSMHFHTKNGTSADKNFDEIKALFLDIKFSKTCQSQNHQAETVIYIDKERGIAFEFLNSGEKLCVGVQVISPGQDSTLIEF